MSFLMGGQQQPAGPQPGSLTWKAQQLGVNPFMFAMLQQGGPGGHGGAGQQGNQARMYMDTFLKRRSANLARAMAQQNQQATF